jgi:signal transduction histidine kinase
LASIKLGNVGLGGVQNQLFSLADFIAAIKVSASLEAQVKECTLIVSAVEPRLAVDGDRELLFSAVGNLLQNARVHSTPHRNYSERLRRRQPHPDRRRGQVRWPSAGRGRLFQSFTQAGPDRRTQKGRRVRQAGFC